MHAFGHSKSLFAALDGTRTGNDGQFGSADRSFPIWEAYDSVILLYIAAHQLVGLADGNDFLHAGHLIQANFHHALVAGDADGGALRSGNAVRPQPVSLDFFTYGAHLLFSGLRLHDN